MGNTGLHNTLEAAVFGVPIIIGNNHEDFPEAQTMIDNNGMLSIANQEELNTALNTFISNESERRKYGASNSDFIKKSKGAIVQILNFLRN